MTNQQTKLQQAVSAIQAQDKSTAQQLLAEIIKSDPNNEDAWLCMAYAVEHDQNRRQCLEHVLNINPDNKLAKRELASLQTDGANLSTSANTAVETAPSEPIEKQNLSIWVGRTKKVYLAIIVGALIGAVLAAIGLSLSASTPGEVALSVLAGGMIGSVIGAMGAGFLGVVYISVYELFEYTGVSSGYEGQERGGCLSVWLIVFMGFNLLSAIVFGCGIAWFDLGTIVFNMANLVFAMALWNWQKWGAYGLGVSFIILLMFGLSTNNVYLMLILLVPIAFSFLLIIPKWRLME